MLIARSVNHHFQKRTLRQLYSSPVSLPGAHFVDYNILGTQIVLPGMVATRTTGGVATACNLSQPIGLFANFVNGTFDELGGGTEVGVWPLAGAYEVLLDISYGESVVDTSIDWKNVANNTLLFSNHQGQITTEIGVFSIGLLVQSLPPSRIIIELDSPEMDAYSLGYYTDSDLSQYKTDPDYQMGKRDRAGDQEHEV